MCRVLSNWRDKLLVDFFTKLLQGTTSFQKVPALKQQAADNMDDECQASKPLHHRSVMRNNDEQNRQSEKMEVRIAEGSKKVKRAMSPNKDGL